MSEEERVDGFVRIPPEYPDKAVAGKQFRVHVRQVHLSWDKGHYYFELACLTIGKAVPPEQKGGVARNSDHVT